jgi:hypothetical protein
MSVAVGGSIVALAHEIGRMLVSIDGTSTSSWLQHQTIHIGILVLTADRGVISKCKAASQHSWFYRFTLVAWIPYTLAECHESDWLRLVLLGFQYARQPMFSAPRAD